MIPQNPTFIPRPFAAEGVAATIPDDKTVFGEASWREGFPIETGLPLNAGGIPPRKADFNGTLKTLSEHTFFQQSGCVYPWSDQLDYLIGSHVFGSNEHEYMALKSSGPTTTPVDPVTEAESEDMTWLDVTAKLQGGGGGSASGIYNTREVLTTSGTYTAPVDGWYKVTCIGGGGGGSASNYFSSGTWTYNGGGGGSGGISQRYKYYTRDTVISFSIGAGGVGGKAAGVPGGAGGDTTFDDISAGGAKACVDYLAGGQGGNGDIHGFCGGGGSNANPAPAGQGGGQGGGVPVTRGNGGNGTWYGAGGAGGGGNSLHIGGDGYQGCVILEYFDPDKLAA